MSNDKSSPPRIGKGRRLDALEGLRRTYENNRKEAATKGDKKAESFWAWLAGVVGIQIRTSRRELNERMEVGGRVGGCLSRLILLALLIGVAAVVVTKHIFSWDEANQFVLSTFGPGYGPFLVIGAVFIALLFSAAGFHPNFFAWFAAIGKRVGRGAAKALWRREPTIDDIHKFLPPDRS